MANKELKISFVEETVHGMTKRRLWENKWSYKEGFVIAFGLFLAGMAIELANGNTPLPVLNYPQNLITGLLYITFLVLGYLFFRKSKLVAFMKSIPVAISSLSFFAWNALIMGLFLQDSSTEGLTSTLSFNQVTSSWFYLFSSLYLLTALGTLIIDKLFHLKKSNLGIFISHLGLWLVIFGGSMGSFEVSRLEMKLQEGQLTYTAKDRSNGTVYEMPFALKLKDFRMEEYPPKIGIVDNVSGKLLHAQGKNIRILEGESSFQIMDWNVELIDYLESAGKAGSKYYFNNETGSPPAAYLRTVSAQGDTVMGWITCGSFSTQYEGLKLDDTHSIIMLYPEPKNYISEIELLLPQGKHSDFLLEVNQPYAYNNWEIYQLSYDDEFGKWSDSSTVELVRDPWLPVVYTGIFLMIAGALYLFWFGRLRKNN